MNARCTCRACAEDLAAAIARAEKAEARVGVLRELLVRVNGARHACEPDESWDWSAIDAALADPDAAAAARDARIRDEALREAASKLEESAVTFKRQEDRAMLALAAHHVRDLIGKVKP